MKSRHILRLLVVIAASLALVACGSSKKKTSSTSSSASKPATLSVSVSQSGKKSVLTAPASTTGGVVTVTLKNSGKAPHEAQLARLDKAKTLADVKKVINSPKIPTWAHLEGGVSAVPPGQTGTASVSL